VGTSGTVFVRVIRWWESGTASFLRETAYRKGKSFAKIVITLRYSTADCELQAPEETLEVNFFLSFQFS
jgi:hypothetical protein